MAATFATPELFETLFEVLPTGVMLLSPCFAAAGELTDFTIEALNPAGQRALALPARPGSTLLQQFPHNKPLGIFARYQQAYLTGERLQVDLPYQADGLDSYYRIVVQRTGELLLMHFTDLTMLDAGVARRALRKTAAEVLATAQRERTRLQAIFMQAPVGIALFKGPAQTVTLANPAICAMWGTLDLAQVVGKPLLEGVPALRGQGFAHLLAEVARTGQPFVGKEVAAELRQADGTVVTRYFNFVYQALHDAAGQELGVLDIAIDVTEQVLARQQVEQLNQELEQRVLARTHQLSAQQQLLSTLFEQAPFAVILLRAPDYVVELVNEASAAILGTAREQVQGRPLFEALPTMREQGLEQVYEQVLAGETVVFDELPLHFDRAGTGQPTQGYVRVSYQPWHNAQGAIVGVLGTGVEVTEQVLARQASEATSQRLRLITNAVPALIGYFDREVRLQFANEAFRSWFSEDPAVLLGRRAPEVVGEAAYQGLLPYVQRALAGERADFELRMPYRPDYVKYVRGSYTPDVHDGQVRGFYSLVNDVTEQVLARQQVEQANSQLTKQRRFLQQLVDLVPAAVATFTGPEHRLTAFNEHYRRMVNRPLELGHTVNELFPEATAQSLHALMTQIYESGQPFQEHEAPVTFRHSGSHAPATHYLNISYEAIRDAQGRSTGLLISSVDVTEQVTARQQVATLNEEMTAINEELLATNEELHESNTRLTRTNADLDTFVYTASHDLKSPITNLEGLVEALQQDLPADVAQSEPVAHLLGLMQDAIARFRQTLNYLTDITQLQRTGSSTLREELDLGVLVEDIRLDLAPAFEASRGELLVSIVNCAKLQGSPKDLRSIIFNLVSNALKYHAPDRPPRVELSAYCTREQVVLKVQDNGLGLSLEQQSHLFRLFRRLHTHVEGSGVGLYSIKKLIDNAGGTIMVESQETVGSVFTVRLPL